MPTKEPTEGALALMYTLSLGPCIVIDTVRVPEITLIPARVTVDGEFVFASGTIEIVAGPDITTPSSNRTEPMYVGTILKVGDANCAPDLTTKFAFRLLHPKK